MAMQPHVARRPSPSGLADVVELILDKGLVIDAFVRVSLLGIELLTVDARIVIASVDTYLRFAEAVNRLDLTETDGSKGLPDLAESISSGASRKVTKRALDKGEERISGAVSSGTARIKEKAGSVRQEGEYERAEDQEEGSENQAEEEPSSEAEAEADESSQRAEEPHEDEETHPQEEPEGEQERPGRLTSLRERGRVY